MTVNAERVRLFVEALRSGRFNQGSGALTTIHPDGTVSYCCLGVATEIARQHGVPLNIAATEAAGGEPRRYCYTEPTATFGEVYYLPSSVRDWYGFSSINPIFHSQVLASTANDTYHWDFDKIADAFERTYLTEGDTT